MLVVCTIFTYATHLQLGANQSETGVFDITPQRTHRRRTDIDFGHAITLLTN